MTNISELANTPDVSLIDTSVEDLLARAVEAFEGQYQIETGQDITLLKDDKIHILLQTAVYLVMMNLMAADYQYKQGCLKYASGPSLDNIGATRGSVVRPESKKAYVPIKYTFDGALSQTQTIPKGNRVSVDEVYFQTTESVVIPEGEESITLTLECTEGGTIGNGFAPGTITTHTDSLPWIKSVENTETSQGGTSPTDDDYTRLIYNTPEGYSVTGPRQAYIAKCFEFSEGIQDVYVETPEDEISVSYKYDGDSGEVEESKNVDIKNSTINIEESNISNYDLDLSSVELDLEFINPIKSMKIHFTPGGRVNIYPLLKDSVIPEGTFLKNLEEFLSGDKMRPLTDKVDVKALTESEYSIDFDYYIDSDNSSDVVTIQNNVVNAVEDFKTWQSNKSGRDINPDELIALVKKAGVKRLVVRNPQFKTLSGSELAKCTEVKISYKGLEES